MVKCPTCSYRVIYKEDVKPVSPVVRKIIRELQVHCDNKLEGCPAVLPLDELRDHCLQCQPPYASSLELEQPSPKPVQLTPSIIDAILKHLLDHPLSAEETKVMYYLVRTFLKQNVDSTPACLECPTGGQVKNTVIYMYMSK